MSTGMSLRLRLSLNLVAAEPGINARRGNDVDNGRGVRLVQRQVWSRRLRKSWRAVGTLLPVAHVSGRREPTRIWHQDVLEGICSCGQSIERTVKTRRWPAKIRPFGGAQCWSKVCGRRGGTGRRTPRAEWGRGQVRRLRRAKVRSRNCSAAPLASRSRGDLPIVPGKLITRDQKCRGGCEWWLSLRYCTVLYCTGWKLGNIEESRKLNFGLRAPVQQHQLAERSRSCARARTRADARAGAPCSSSGRMALPEGMEKLNCGVFHSPGSQLHRLPLARGSPRRGLGYLSFRSTYPVASGLRYLMTCNYHTST